MHLPAIVPLALLGISFVFAVIELGLAGHIASAGSGSRRMPVPDSSSFYGYTFKTVKVSVPAIVAFVIFTAVWTMLVSVAAILLPWFFRTKAGAGSRLSTMLTGALGGLYFVTMVFWLASFADIAARLDGVGATSDYYNAVIAFAVLLWYVYVHTSETVDVANVSDQAALRRALRLRCSCRAWGFGVRCRGVQRHEEEGACDGGDPDANGRGCIGMIWMFLAAAVIKLMISRFLVTRGEREKSVSDCGMLLTEDTAIYP
jgi:hypothetical protein